MVTGAAGFVGAQVVRFLLTAGHEVGALVSPNNPAARLAGVSGRVTLLRCDLSEDAAVRTILTDWLPEVCIHLAWYAEPGLYLQSLRNTDSLVASLRLVQALGEAGCRRFVGAGTCFEYNVECGWLHEEGPTQAETVYAAAKLSLGLTGGQIARTVGMQFAWARLFYLYGPREDVRRVIPALITSLLSGRPFPATAGEQVRDYLHVEDVASAFAALTESDVEGIFNISSGIPLTMASLMRETAGIIGRPALLELGEIPYRPWEPRFICGDNARLRTLGWEPRVVLEEGLRATVNWWATHTA